MPLKIELVYDASRGPGHAIARIQGLASAPASLQLRVARNSDQHFLRHDRQWVPAESWIPLEPGDRDGDMQLVPMGPVVVDSVVGAPANVRFQYVFRADGRDEPAQVRVTPSVRTSLGGGGGTVTEPPPAPPPPPPPLTPVPPEPEPAPTGGDTPAPVGDTPARGGDSGAARKAGLAVGAIALLALLGGGAWFMFGKPPDPGAPPPVAAPAPPTAAAPVTLESLADVNRYLQGSPAPAESLREGQGLLQRGKPDLAMLLFQHAARGNEPEAAVAMARMYDPETWTAATSALPKPDAETAAYWYEPAARAGKAVAQRRLGQILVELNFSPSQRSQGVDWLKRAAEAGDADARRILEGLK